jgi:pimeloyl-ACP methyl ester carboxylesterase
MQDIGSARAPGLRRIVFAAGLIAVALTAGYVFVDEEPEVIHDAIRAAAGGSAAKLAGGTTWYDARGAENAPTVILVHGTTIPSMIWERNVDALVSAGLRVVRYDMFGRGLSDRPDAAYDLDFHVAQLAGLVDHVAPERQVDLVGFSMGGIVAGEYARRHEARIRKIVLFAPGGAGNKLPPVAKMAIAPGVGEYLMRVTGSRQLRPTRRNFLHADRYADFDRRYEQTTRFEGSRRAVLRSIRNMPLEEWSGFRDLGRLRKPVLLIWGREDAVVPFQHAETVRAAVKAEDLVVFENAGHAVMYERSEDVNRTLAGFLGGAG